MNRIFIRGALIGLLISAGLCLGGCKGREAVLLRTGTINSTAVLQNDDKYQELSRQYFAERIKAASEVQRIVKEHSDANGTVTDKAIYDKLLKIQNDVEGKWRKITSDYVDKKMDSMKSAAEKVASENNLDLILIDSNDVPTVEYGAHDVTGNVLGKMPGFAGGDGAEQPTATSAAAGSSQGTKGGSANKASKAAEQK